MTEPRAVQRPQQRVVNRARKANRQETPAPRQPLPGNEQRTKRPRPVRAPACRGESGGVMVAAMATTARRDGRVAGSNFGSAGLGEAGGRRQAGVGKGRGERAVDGGCLAWGLSRLPLGHNLALDLEALGLGVEALGRVAAHERRRLGREVPTEARLGQL